MPDFDTVAAAKIHQFLSDYADANLKLVLEKHLANYEYATLTARFGDNLDKFVAIDWASNSNGITSERLRQIESKLALKLTSDSFQIRIGIKSI